MAFGLGIADVLGYNGIPMNDKNKSDLQFLYDVLATANKDLTTVHARLDGGDGALAVGIAQRHLAQAVQFLAEAIRPENPRIDMEPDMQYSLGLNSGTNS